MLCADTPPRSMKLEFLADASEGPTLLFYGTHPDEVAKLRKAVRELSEWPGRKLAFHELAYVEAVGHCELVGVCGSRDIGVRKPSEDVSFEWLLGSSSWSKVEGLLEPFCVATPGPRFQFLNPAFGPEVIYSTQRRG